VEEKDLTEKQRRWLEASRKIGPGPMTKSERRLLEQLYADMEPREQQDLYDYIQMKFGDKETKEQRPSEDQLPDDPISRMQGKIWREPSGAFKRALSSLRRTTPPGR
jgi:hypothetical protein